MDFLNRMNEVIGYIEENITEDFNVNKVAKIAGCSAYQFSRILFSRALREMHGVSPREACTYNENI